MSVQHHGDAHSHEGVGCSSDDAFIGIPVLAKCRVRRDWRAAQAPCGLDRACPAVLRIMPAVHSRPPGGRTHVGVATAEHPTMFCEIGKARASTKRAAFSFLTWIAGCKPMTMV